MKEARGYLELSIGIGLQMGPIVGGICFWIGGYTFPFYFLGFISLFVGIGFTRVIIIPNSLDDYT